MHNVYKHSLVLYNIAKYFNRLFRLRDGGKEVATMPQTDKNTVVVEKLNLLEARNYKVVKSNDLVQKSRFQLSAQEQKIILYLISKIKPDHEKFETQALSIGEFCRVCGININGKNYNDIKSAVKELADKSIWVMLDNGEETVIRWIERPFFNKRAGTIRVKFDDYMKPYLLQLHERFTQFELLYTLAMKSQYSIRLYEILKSYEYKRNIVLSIKELKEQLFATQYSRYPDFKRNVLDKALKEIDELSDLNISYQVIKEGRTYTKFQFSIQLKSDMSERFAVWKNIEDIIGDKRNKALEC